MRFSETGAGADGGRAALRRRERQRGLTLFELLIVLAILALLAGLVAPRVIGYLGRAKSDVAATQLSSLVTAIELYALDVGAYPTESEGLGVLVHAPGGNALWAGPYLKDENGLTDPWGEPYRYELNEADDFFTVGTLGRDKAAGGEGEDRDLSKS